MPHGNAVVNGYGIEFLGDPSRPDDLFGNQVAKEMSESQLRRQRFRKSILDFVLEDACKIDQLSEPSGFKVLSLSTALSGFTTLKLPRNLSTLVSSDVNHSQYP